MSTRRCALFAALGAALVFANPAAAALGDPLAPSLEGDFFSFFGFSEASRAPAGDGLTAIAFGQRAQSPFKALVALELVVDASGRLVAAELALQRSFVDGPTEPFARDVAKSFLRFATPAADAKALADLAREIEAGFRPTSGAVVIRRGPAPTLPDPPTPGYRAFLGEVPSFERRLTRSTLRIDHVTRSDAPWVVITLGPLAPGDDDGAAAPLAEDAWRAVFLDAGDLPGLARGQDARDGGADEGDAAFVAEGGQRAGLVAWMARAPDAALWRVVDVRWVFPTEDAAERYLAASWRAVSEGLPRLAWAVDVGHDARLYGGTQRVPLLETEMTQYIVALRVGRVVIKIFAAEGDGAEAPGLTPARMVALARAAAERANPSPSPSPPPSPSPSPNPSP